MAPVLAPKISASSRKENVSFRSTNAGHQGLFSNFRMLLLEPATDSASLWQTPVDG
jgi:hypothetical protein